MKLTHLLVLFLLAAILLSACTPEMVPTPVPTQAPTSQEQPTSVPTTPTPQSGTDEARTELAKKLGVKESDIQVVSVEKVNWPDSCLGLPNTDEMCSQIVTPGLKIILKVGGITYEAHTTSDGSNVRFANHTPTLPAPVPTQSGSGNPTDGSQTTDVQNPAVLAAIEALVKQTGLSADQIKVVSADQVEWPDGCLGVNAPGRMCTMMITPGFKIILEAAGQQYEFHTNMDGQTVLLATAQLPQTSAKVLVWEQTSNSGCNRLEAGPDGVAFGPCKGTLLQAPYVSKERALQLNELTSEYASFFSGTVAGTVNFTGTGQKQASENEQRAIAEWAKLVFLEAQSGRGGAAWNLAIGFHREGGIAGFCDDLGIYASGWVEKTSCKTNSQVGKPARLTSEQLDQLYAWMDKFGNFEYESKDPAAADAMTIRYTFTGYGTAAPTDAQKQEIAQFASDVLAQK